MSKSTLLNTLYYSLQRLIVGETRLHSGQRIGGYVYWPVVR